MSSDKNPLHISAFGNRILHKEIGYGKGNSKYIQGISP